MMITAETESGSRAEGVPSPASGAPGWGGAAAAPTGEASVDRLGLMVAELRRQYLQSYARRATASANASRATNEQSRRLFEDRVLEHSAAVARAAHLLGLAGSELPA